MEWETLGVIAGILGTIFAFISLIIAIRSERKKENSLRSTGATEQKESLFRLRVPQFSKGNVENTSSHQYNKSSDVDSSFDPYIPYRYILIGLLGGIGGASVIFLPLSDEIIYDGFNFCTGPLIITGLISGITFALIMDESFTMDRASPFLRYSLSFISGLIAGWLGVLVLILVILAGVGESSNA